MAVEQQRERPLVDQRDAHGGAEAARGQRHAPRGQARAEALARGGYGYGDAKKALLAAIDERFAPARERRRQLAARPAEVDEVLAAGAARARAEAQRTLEKVAVPPKKVVKFKVGRVMRECVTLEKPFQPPPSDDD